MSPLGRRGKLPAEYVAAGVDLALVRVEGVGATELIVSAGGRSEAFDALPGAPGDDHVGFPVPLEFVLAAGGEFRAVVDGDEGGGERPVEAGAGARPPVGQAPPGPPVPGPAGGGGARG